MQFPNAARHPPIWDDAALRLHVQKSLIGFVERRLSEPQSRYLQHLEKRKSETQKLVRLLAPFDIANPDPSIVRAIFSDPELEASLRYVAGPPISADDLGVVVTRRPERLGRGRIKADASLGADIIRLICSIADPARFPWVRQGRAPRAHELKLAIRATASIRASQTMQMERRGYGKIVEAMLRERLSAGGFTRVAARNGGKIDAPNLLPAPRAFYGECSLYGRRTDILIGLPDGRCVAVEAKDSSSVVNSVKRVLNDTAAKARLWRDKLGETAIPVALLSGVFGVEHLKAAQASGLFLAWAHDLDGLMEWLLSQ